jgi:hypothetical protein
MTWPSLDGDSSTFNNTEVLERNVLCMRLYNNKSQLNTKKDRLQYLPVEQASRVILLAHPTWFFFYTQQQWLQLYSQEGLTHGAGIAMDFPI